MPRDPLRQNPRPAQRDCAAQYTVRGISSNAELAAAAARGNAKIAGPDSDGPTVNQTREPAPFMSKHRE